MLTHRGFSAWIEVGGKRVPEYLVAVDSTAHRVSCWVTGEAGQTFSVYWRDHGGRVETCTFITLDGYVVPGRFLRGEGIGWRAGVRTSETTERPFMFQKVEENADADSPGQDASKDAGKIILRIKRVKMVAAHEPNPVQPLPSQLAFGNHKAGELRVGFGDEKPFYVQYKTTWAVEPYDQDESGSIQPTTYVSFVFRYRSREFLEAQGILEEEKKPPVRKHVRRVASVPPLMPSLLSPTPSPPKKAKTKPKPTFYRAGPYRLRRPSADLRRTVSWKLTERTTMHTYEERYTSVPEDPLLPFDDIMVKDEGSTSGDTCESSPDYTYENSPNCVYESSAAFESSDADFDPLQLDGEPDSPQFC